MPGDAGALAPRERASAPIVLALSTDFPRLLSLARGDRPAPNAAFLDRRALRPGAAVRAIARAAAGRDAIVVDGSVGLSGRYADLAATALLSRRRHGPAVVIADSTWKAGDTPLRRSVRKLGLRAFDSARVTYVVHSSGERASFSSNWGVPGERVAFVRWCHILPPEELDAPVSTAGGVFAGGDSWRDYRTLVEAVRGLAVPVRVATRTSDWLRDVRVPPNVHVGAERATRFDALLRDAAVVVVPLTPNLHRSAGQTVFVNAMALGKPVIVSENVVIADYIEPGVTGLVVPPRDPAALRRAIDWTLDPANAVAVREIGRRARSFAREELRPARYVADLIRVAERAAAARDR